MKKSCIPQQHHHFNLEFQLLISYCSSQLIILNGKDQITRSGNSEHEAN